MKQDFTHKELSRLCFIMRVSFVNLLLLVIPCLQVLSSENASGQNMHDAFVKIDVENVSLKTIIKIIENQTEFLFVYSPELIEGYDYVSFKNDHVPVAEALDEILHNLPIEFKKSKGNILLFRKEIDNEDYTEIISIKGRVSGTNGIPLPGVNVIVKGTTIGTTTDADGYYSIDMPVGSDVLVFSFIGFATQEVNINAQTDFNITLHEDVMALEEVEIRSTGYWSDTKEKSTGSIVKVTAKEIEKQPVTNPLMALQGRVPGLEITPGGGAPGVAPTIRIRGTNSLREKGVSPENNGNYPLYVIDGVPITSAPILSFGGSYTGAGYDPLSTLNPSSIESIEVLKDGDATAIYGSRGANGVILITTKLGAKSADRTNFEITSYIGAGQVSKKFDLLNTSQYVAMRKEAIKNDNLAIGPLDSDLNVWDSTRYTDWQKLLIGGTANISDIQGTLSAGNKNTSFRFNGGYHKETLVFPGDFYYQRASGQLSVNHKSTDNKFTGSISATYGLEDNLLFNDAGGLVSAAVSLPPNAPPLNNPDGTLNWEMFMANGQLISSWTNPLSYLLNKQTTKTNNFLTSGNFSYDLYDGIILSINGGYTNMNSLEVGVYPSMARQPNNPAQGNANFRENKRHSWILEPKLSYVKNFGVHSFSGLVGGTLQSNSAIANLTLASKYPSDALLGSIKGASVIDISQEDYTVYKYMSTYARLGYTLSQRYLINFTARRDGSSRFGPGNRFGNFGAIGIGWIFSNEKFLQSASNILSFGKLRASYGKTGSDQVGDYKYFDLYDITTYKYNGRNGFTPSALFNSDYAWEVTKKLEAAVELSFFDNRISFEINWYRNRSSNQLINYTLPIITGFSSVTSNFPATVQNTGIEGIVNAEILNSGNWRWSLALNISLPKNKLVKFEGIEESPYATFYKVGQPLSVQALYTYKGINQETGLYDFVDQNNDGLFNDLDKTLQNPNDRAFYGGLNHTIQYKMLELALLFQFSNQSASRYYAGVMPGLRNNQPIEVLDHWQKAGDLVDTQRYSTLPTATQRYNLLVGSNYSVVNAAFVRLKTVSIALRLPQQWLKKTKMQQAKVFCQGQNILTFTSYPGLDPETGNTLPPLRMITVGLQCSF
jgi:TonB-linked SusC/RagA family outer membrane protein